MPDTIVESVLTGKLDMILLVRWLNNESIEEIPEDSVLFNCNRSEFVAYFLSFLRNQTDSILQTNSNAAQILHHSTPEKILHSRRKHRRSVSDPTSDDRTMDSLTIKTDRQRSHESPSKDKKRTGRRVKTKLFTEEKKECTNQSISSDESRISMGVERIALSSTPLKNGLKLSDYPNVTSPVTPHSRSLKEYERCDTPRLSHRHSRSSEKSCLGDYIVNATKSSKKKKAKSTSNEDDNKNDLDLSNSDMFPEIGARKASSLRSEKRRIKPTNIDKSQKSISLNSFNSDVFQQPSPLALENNIAFKQQKIQPKESASFEVERNILKKERHMLMEKFNILNTSTSPNTIAMPQIKVTQKDMTEKSKNYIKADVNKIVLKDKIDCLVEIYDVLLKNNLILSVTTEIYFLISILISKQCENDYLNSESRLTERDMNYLLRTVHNSTYFAVKSLWNQKSVLEVILDKNSLKTLGENKKVRSFYPELAKSLLNCYGLKCEAETQDRPRLEVVSNGVICFNFETDNVENFPSMLSFQNFKKQRDMFYEILRWYQDTQSSGGSRTSFRARIKTLLSCGPTAANHAHLSALFVAHMLAECLPTNIQESKLSKLQRRLTCPTAPDSHRLPHFTDKETFYKEFITQAENECFRVHVKDALASEITILDATSLAVDERGNSNNPDISREYLQLVKKLGLLSKFLGYLTSLPYSQIPIDAPKVMSIKGRDNYVVPKEKVLENEVGRRNYSQPSIDIKGMLTNAHQNGRLCITIPWLVHYLSMLDYTSLRIKYYQDLLKILFEIYENKLKLHIETTLRKNTIIFLKSILGWLFDLPHFPQDLFYENRQKLSVASENNVDCMDLVDELIIFELCPCLKDVNMLLSTCRVSQEQKESSYRHITPVSLSLNPEDRIRNKEKELQGRLEEELLKSQPSSTRRVLELVIERVTSACVRDLTAGAGGAGGGGAGGAGGGGTLSAAREEARDAARRLVRDRDRDTPTDDTTSLLDRLQALYRSQHARLAGRALGAAEGGIRARTGAALAALLPAAAPPLLALSVRACRARLAKWLADNWATTAILCKDIEAEMKILIALSEVGPQPAHATSVDVQALLTPSPQFEAVHVSPAECIIHLKEQICLVLEQRAGEGGTAPGALLAAVARGVAATNVFCRAPPRRAALQLTLDLCLVYVSKNPQEITEEFLNQLHEIWNTCCPDRKKSHRETSQPERREGISPEHRNFDDDDKASTPISDEEKENKEVQNEVTVKKVKETTNCAEENNEYIEFFDRILCPRNIVLLSASKCKSSDVWEALATVLVFLLQNDYLSEDSLTEQCLAVYRQDWPQTILESLSSCMKSVSSRWSRSSAGKFTLFLDFLAEYCGDMDYEPME